MQNGYPVSSSEGGRNCTIPPFHVSLPDQEVLAWSRFNRVNMQFLHNAEVPAVDII